MDAPHENQPSANPGPKRVAVVVVLLLIICTPPPLLLLAYASCASTSLSRTMMYCSPSSCGTAQPYGGCTGEACHAVWPVGKQANIANCYACMLWSMLCDMLIVHTSAAARAPQAVLPPFRLMSMHARGVCGVGGWVGSRARVCVGWVGGQSCAGVCVVGGWVGGGAVVRADS